MEPSAKRRERRGGPLLVERVDVVDLVVTRIVGARHTMDGERDSVVIRLVPSRELQVGLELALEGRGLVAGHGVVRRTWSSPTRSCSVRVNSNGIVPVWPPPAHSTVQYDVAVMVWASPALPAEVLV